MEKHIVFAPQEVAIKLEKLLPLRKQMVTY
jgi:hypothetical protein